MKATYLDLITRLKTHTSTTGKIAWYDLWNNQPNNMDKEDPFPYPAVFFDFGTINWREVQYGVQEGDCTLRIIVVQDDYANSDDSSNNQASALSVLDLLQDINKALNGYSSTHLRRLVRTASTIDSDHDASRIDIIEYQCTMLDCSTSTNIYTATQLTGADIVVTPNTVP